jgi:hypothetical protein
MVERGHLIPLRAISGGMGIRTPDLLIANETLYQLSYTPKVDLSRNPASASAAMAEREILCARKSKEQAD